MKLPENFYNHTLNFLKAVLSEEAFEEQFSDLKESEEEEVEVTQEQYDKIYATVDAVQERESFTLFGTKYMHVDKETGRKVKRTKNNKDKVQQIVDIANTLKLTGDDVRTGLGQSALAIKVDLVALRQKEE